MTEYDPDLTRVVHAEVSEALDALLELSENLSAHQCSSSEFVRSAFRIFHNVKGALRLAGFDAAEHVAHAVEDRLSVLRDSGQAPSAEFVDAVEQALEVCVKAVEARGTHPELDRVLSRITGLGGREACASDAVSDLPGKAGRLAAPSQSSVPETPQPGFSKARAALRIDPERLDRLMDLGSEYLAQYARQRRQRTFLREFADRLGQLAKRSSGSVALLSPLASEFEGFVRAEERELRRAAQLTHDFDGAMRRVRMQPLGVVTPHLRRVVSEAARHLGKSVHLEVDLGDVEIDRLVLDALHEPLMHLLRNAVDHGIEPVSQRIARGKPERGEITVSARLEGANVQLEVKDDGAGVDFGRVRARALELGLVAADETPSLAQLVDRALFTPGFSTKAEVSHVSGRGVGLDVVRARVAELGGQVYASFDDASAGSVFRLSVPASVVSLRGLAVRAGGSSFVLPSSQVERTLRVRAHELGSAEGSTVVRTPEGVPLCLRWLASAMGLRRTEDPAILQVAVLVEGSQKLGLVVDAVEGDTSFVIKRLPWNVRRAKGVIGATHQGDAALALVVDTAHLFRLHGAAPDLHRLKLPMRQSRFKILVADDSLTSRTLQRNILVQAGYEVQVVEDGNAALSALEHEPYDLLVSDVQMPVIDGFELTRKVRAHARLARLPIILVTSLERPEDVSEGAAAGADEYIVKGQFDQEVLLTAVSRLL